MISYGLIPTFLFILGNIQIPDDQLPVPLVFLHVLMILWIRLLKEPTAQ
jgi:hypothetical protein